jgi:hypothetical protein
MEIAAQFASCRDMACVTKWARFWCGQPAEALFSRRQEAAFEVRSRGPLAVIVRAISVNGAFPQSGRSSLDGGSG